MLRREALGDRGQENQKAKIRSQKANRKKGASSGEFLIFDFW
jgi:hypothetical protein